MFKTSYLALGLLTSVAAVSASGWEKFNEGGHFAIESGQTIHRTMNGISAGDYKVAVEKDPKPTFILPVSGSKTGETVKLKMEMSPSEFYEAVKQAGDVVGIYPPELRTALEATSHKTPLNQSMANLLSSLDFNVSRPSITPEQQADLFNRLQAALSRVNFLQPQVVYTTRYMESFTQPDGTTAERDVTQEHSWLASLGKGCPEGFESWYRQNHGTIAGISQTDLDAYNQQNKS